MKRSIPFACAAAGVLFVAGCNKGEPVAAIVNGESITEKQYYKYLELMPQVQVVVEPGRLQAPGGGQIPQQPYKGPVVGSLGLQALNDLIQQSILKQLAREEGVYPNDQEVKQELDDRTKANPTFVRELTNNGFTLDQIRNDIALSLAQYKLITKGVTVTPQDVDTYIKEHPREFIVPETVDMIWMLVPEDKKQAADAELKSGINFMTVAQKYTVAPNAAKMQNRFPEQMIPNLAKFGPELMPEVKKTAEQRQTKWIKFTEGWAKFYVNKKNPERKVAIDADMKKKVHRAISMQRGALARDLGPRIQEKLRRATIVIKVEHLKEPWKRSFDSLQTTAGANAAGTTTTP